MTWSPRRRWISPACLASVLALSACTKKGDDTTVQPTPTAKVTPAPIQLAPVEHPSEMLPRDTHLLVTVASVERVAEVFERDRLIEAFGPQYVTLRALVTTAMGHDLLDPAVWPAVGLDPKGPLGISVSGAVRPRVVAFASIGDQVKLVEFLRTVAGKAQVELIEQSYGSALVLRPKGEDDAAVVLRDGLMAVVLEDPGEGIDAAELLVTMDPNVSLASTVGYRKATGGLRAADLTAYVDIAGMVEQASMESEARASAPEKNWAQEELVEAQKRGESPERLAQLERQVEEENERQAEWRQRDAGQRDLAELLVSGIESTGFTVTVKRSGPIFDGRVVADEGAFLRRLVRNREGAPVLTQAMNGAPMFCMSGRVQPEPVLELVKAVAAAEGEEVSAMMAEAKAETGLELQTDLMALSGASELCLTQVAELDASAEDPAKALGLGVVLSTSDEAKAKYLLAKVASSSGELGQRIKKKGEGYVVDVPKWVPLHVKTWGNRIVIGSDPELATRLAAGTPGSMPSKVRPSGARGAMDLPGTAFSQAFDLSLSMLWLMSSRPSFGDEPMFAVAGLSAEELQKVPLSKKSKKARKALDKANERLEAIERKREAAQFEQMKGVFDPLGIVVMAATADERGFTVTGGQFLRVDSLGQMVEGLLEVGGLVSQPGMTEADTEALDAAWQARSEANMAYVDARTEDAERFVAKQQKQGGPKQK